VLEPDVTKTRRHLPHWELDGSTYFVTFRTAGTRLSSTERSLVLGHIRGGHRKYYALYAVAVMPDHVHLLLRPNDGVSLSRVMKGIKGVSSHLVNAARGTSGQTWQSESYDRIMRSPREFEEKLAYIAENPLAAELVDDAFAYRWSFFNDGEALHGIERAEDTGP
jgi:REP element-mobilizing transposase RayT